MFSKFIRLGALISGAVILSSCGSGTGQTETQLSTPEGLFTGTTTVYINPTGAVTTTPTPCTVNTLMFINYAGTFYSFFSPVGSGVVSASSGQLTFSGGNMGSNNVLQVTPPNGTGASATAPNGTYCGVALADANGLNNQVTLPSFTGAYNTAINNAGTYTYPNVIDANNDFETATISLGYNTGYQGVQSLATLAGRYSGTVGTSQFSEAATFIFSSASVPANSGNQFGVATVNGTGASGCIYTGTVSPLFKGNGYNLLLSVGGSPCQLIGTTFQGLVYLDTANNFVYSFSPNPAHNDGLIFTGARK
jgi:hypothetical protein